MKNDETDLSSLLQKWRIGAALPPRFTEQVWKRIERAEAPGISVLEALRARFAMVFARPAFAVAYVSLLLIAGLTVGFMQANQKTADWDRQLEGRYVQSVDPYQRGR